MTTKLINDNTEAFYRISNLYYSMGEEEDSLRYLHVHVLYNSYCTANIIIVLIATCGGNDPLPGLLALPIIISTYREIRECLKLDPDHKTCFPFYKVSSLLLLELRHKECVGTCGCMK